MTDLVMTHAVNPIWESLKKIFFKIVEVQMTIGKARAAAELSRMGYYKEARDIMLNNK